MKLLACSTLTFALLACTVLANTEKTIFTAPKAINLPDANPGLDFLQLTSLSHVDPSLRLPLPVAFTDDEHPRGLDSWYLLKGLNEQQRYELRVCWPATQPTKFWLDVHTLSDVFDTPHLIQNLAGFVDRPKPRGPHTGPSTRAVVGGTARDSLLFLHIQAAADFFSPNRTLMSDPPAVDVDIILDPYFASIFPQSLIPTAGYIVVLAVTGWLISGFLWKVLSPANDVKAHKD